MRQWVPIALYLLAATAIAGCLLFATRTADDFRLLRKGNAASGRVVSKNCELHMSFVYQFTASGRSIEGSASSSDCHEMQIGDRISIHYLDSDPRINSIGDLDRKLWNNLIPISIASLIIPLVPILAFLRKKQKKADDSRAD